MNLSFRLPRRTPKAAPKHGPKGFTRFPVPPGMPGPDATMYIPVVQDERETGDAEQTPAVRPIPVPVFTGAPLEFPPAADPTDAEVLARVRDGLRALPAEPAPVAGLVLPGAY